MVTPPILKQVTAVSSAMSAQLVKTPMVTPPIKKIRINVKTL
jgi:hypothetical protein